MGRLKNILGVGRFIVCATIIVKIVIFSTFGFLFEIFLPLWLLEYNEVNLV